MKTYPLKEKKHDEVWYKREGLTTFNGNYSEQYNTPAALAMALDMAVRESRRYKAELEKIRNRLNGVLAGNGDTV